MIVYVHLGEYSSVKMVDWVFSTLLKRSVMRITLEVRPIDFSPQRHNILPSQDGPSRSIVADCLNHPDFFERFPEMVRLCAFLWGYPQFSSIFTSFSMKPSSHKGVPHDWLQTSSRRSCSAVHCGLRRQVLGPSWTLRLDPEKLCLAPNFWVNYNELTTTSLEIIVSKGKYPQIALIQVSELL